MTASIFNWPAELPESIANEIIIKASLVDYKDLPSKTRETIGTHAWYSTGGWRPQNMSSFETENGYYVRALIDVRKLARLTLLNSCGSAIEGYRCSERELKKKIPDFANRPDPRTAYGKYKNHWMFYSEAGLIPSTSKFRGHRTLHIERERRSMQDEILIGPLPYRPIEIQIRAYESWTKKRGRIEDARKAID